MAIVAKYSLNGNANDSAGSNNGTATNVTWVAGKSGQAGSFNGSSSKITANTPIGGTLTTSFKYSVLVKINSNPATSADIVFEQVSGIGSRIIRYNNNSGTMRIMGVIDASSPVILTYNINLLGKYTFISFSYNSSNGKSSLFLDGVVVASTTTPPSGNQINTINAFSIGTYNGKNFETGVNFTNGVIDEVIIDNSPPSLTQEKNKYLFYNGFM